MRHWLLVLAAVLPACGAIDMAKRSARAGLSIQHSSTETDNDATSATVDSSSTAIAATIAANLPSAPAVEVGVEVAWRSSDVDTDFGIASASASSTAVDLLGKARIYVIESKAPATPWVELAGGAVFVDSTSTANNQNVSADGGGGLLRLGGGVQIATGSQSVFDVGLFYRAAFYDIEGVRFDDRGIFVSAGYSILF